MEEERVLALKAEAAKELQAGKFSEAIAKYDEALKLIDKTHKQYLAVSGNKALACLKAERWQEGLEAATAALTEMPNYSELPEESSKTLYQKILYRRGVCEQGLGRMSSASASFGELIKRDPSNTEAARRLNECNVALKKARKRFGDIFGGDSMYDDRVRQTELRKQREQAEYEANHEEGVSFEEWREQRERAEQLAREEKQKKNPPRLRQTKSSSQPSELEVDEEDKKILEETKNRGYCYFKRELTEDERKLKDQVHVPQKLDETAAASNSTAAVETTTVTSPPRGVSSWNHGTTYEEKDTTAWCKDLLQNTLSGAEVKTDGFTIKTSSIEKLTGDAQIMVVRSSLRHFFDFSGNIKFSVEKDDGGVMIASGTLVCDSITGAVDTTKGVGNYLTGAKVSWVTPVDQQYRPKLAGWVSALENRLNELIADFHQVYKEKY